MSVVAACSTPRLRDGWDRRCRTRRQIDHERLDDPAPCAGAGGRRPPGPCWAPPAPVRHRSPADRAAPRGRQSVPHRSAERQPVPGSGALWPSSPVDEQPQGSDPAAEPAPRVTRAPGGGRHAGGGRPVAAELAGHAARYGPLRPADVHAPLDGASGSDGRPSPVVASWTATALPSRRRTGPRGGRRPGWFLPPTGPWTPRRTHSAGTSPPTNWTSYPRSGTTPAGSRACSATVTRSTPDATPPRTSGRAGRPARAPPSWEAADRPGPYAGQPSAEPGTAVGLVTGSDRATRGAPSTRARAGRSSAGGSRSGSSRARRRGSGRR
jgi:hypothetical protein